MFRKQKTAKKKVILGITIDNKLFFDSPVKASAESLSKAEYIFWNITIPGNR